MIQQPFFTPAILLVLFAIPLALGWVPRNRFYGIRTRRALADDVAWYRINRSGAWCLIVSGLFYLAVAWVVPMSGPQDVNFRLWLLHLFAFVLPLLLGLVRIRHLSRQD